MLEDWVCLVLGFLFPQNTRKPAKELSCNDMGMGYQFKRALDCQGDEASKHCATPGFVMPPSVCWALAVSLGPHSAHHLRGQVAPYAGLHYSARAWACSEPTDTRTWDKLPCLTP